MLSVFQLLGEFFYEEGSVLVFALISIVLNGGGAFLIGRAIAATWRPWWHVVLAMLVLGAVARFFHYALFGGTLLSLHYYVVDTVFSLSFGLWGYRLTRAGQMAGQYGWLYRRAGPLSWAKKRPAPNAAAPESG